jgi:iron(III) transport system substrate-binding protein
MKRPVTTLLASVSAAGASWALAAPALADGEVNVYSYRQEVLMRPLFQRFTKRTGIQVNTAFVKQGMLTRLKAEGRNSPADVVLTVDAARLIRVDKAGVFQPVSSKVLEANIPAKYRHPKGHWFGLTMRARPIMYNPAKVKPSELSTYEALADPKWRGRICIRSSNSVYNLSLIASLIAHNGKEATQKWANAFVKNFARKPAGGDRDQIRAVAAGECDIALANTYYLGALSKSKKESDRQAAAAVRIFWPNQKGRGTHVNISGAGVTKSAKNRANAIKLLEFLSSAEAQRIYADQVNEYPVKPGVGMSTTVAAWGEFKADDISLYKLAEHQQEALRVADRAGWR